MSNLFLRLLNISITAGWIVLVVVLLRFVLKYAPKWIRVALWGLVAVRLLVPVSIESVLSLVPSAETVSVEPVTYEIVQVRDSNPEPVPSTTVEGERIVLHSGFEMLNSAVNPVMVQARANAVTVMKSVAGWVWLGGAVAMLLYALISYLRLRHKVGASAMVEKGVYVCDDISDPFILGLIAPKIYLPSGTDEITKGYVLAHEKAHLSRFDHIWKPLGFLLLAVYWFNPLLWLAYILLCRDIELACDEKVVKEYDVEDKAAYSEALLKSSVSRRSIAACPLAFGEVGVKSRVKAILNYKKPAFWIILVALLAGIVVAVCFLTVPKKEKDDAEPEATATPDVIETTLHEFPGVMFRQTAGSVEAVENGNTRTLFSGMPIWNVFFADVTGDGKPELCATVSFGSGIVDDHIVVYDYANRQSYTLWERGVFDYHLSMVDGVLTVHKKQYNNSSMPVLDTGTLVMHDSVPCCQWQGDGSFTPSYRELHESELLGEWLVVEERDADDNVLYTSGLDLWKEYHFKDDGIVTYNETVPISSNAELAFGHPVGYRYAVYDNYVHIEDGRSCYGYKDPQTQTLMLIYQTSPNQLVYATLRRMGEGTQGETTLDEATLCTIWRLAEIKAPDGSNGDARALGLEQYLVFRSDGTVRMLDMKESSDRTVPYTQNGNTVRFDDRVLRYDSALKELIWIDPTSQDILSYTPAPNAVLPESTAESAAANMLIDLRARYPEFFDLPTENGLTVYVYQMAPRDFHFGLLPGTERQDNRDMSYLCKASLDEMKLILSDYPITPDRIEIHAARNDLSSYHYEINAAYLAQIRTLLFGEIDAGLFRDQTVEELILGIYTCCGAMDHGSFIPVPDAFVGMQIDLNDSIVLPDVDWQKEYFHFAAVTIGGTVKTGYDWNVDGNNVLTVQNEETKDTWTMYWSPSAYMLYMNANDDLSGKSVVLIFKCDD